MCLEHFKGLNILVKKKKKHSESNDKHFSSRVICLWDFLSFLAALVFPFCFCLLKSLIFLLSFQTKYSIPLPFLKTYDCICTLFYAKYWKKGFKPERLYFPKNLAFNKWFFKTFKISSRNSMAFIGHWYILRRNVEPSWEVERTNTHT